MTPPSAGPGSDRGQPPRQAKGSADRIVRHLQRRVGPVTARTLALQLLTLAVLLSGLVVAAVVVLVKLVQWLGPWWHQGR
ncbi:MAG: hypothetical protein ACKO8I_14155 [Cyanobacteriota bacterium]